MKDVKVKFSLLDVIGLMESDIITSAHNDITEIESSELISFSNGKEDEFILHLKVPSPETKVRTNTFSREQLKHILAGVAAAENGEVIDEIEGVGIVTDAVGNSEVSWKAFEIPDAVDCPPDTAIDEWTDYLLGLRDTTQCDKCPARKSCPDSLAK